MEYLVETKQKFSEDETNFQHLILDIVQLNIAIKELNTTIAKSNTKAKCTVKATPILLLNSEEIGSTIKSTSSHSTETTYTSSQVSLSYKKRSVWKHCNESTPNNIFDIEMLPPISASQ